MKEEDNESSPYVKQTPPFSLPCLVITTHSPPADTIRVIFTVLLLFNSLFFLLYSLSHLAVYTHLDHKKNKVKYYTTVNRHSMEGANIVDAKELDLVDNASNVQVEDNPSVEDIKQSDLVKENPMPSQQQEEAVIKKKYGGLLPKKNPLISKDHERAFFDSADWALGKGAQKSKGPLEALRPKLQPTHHQQARSRRSGRSAYAPAGEGEVDVDNTSGVTSEDGGSNDDTQSEDINHHN